MRYRAPGQRFPADLVRQPRGFETVTVSYRYGDTLRTLVARDAPTAHAQTRSRWGEPDSVASLSTPTTILSDLSGETARRAATKGMWATSEQERMPSERA
jgi:hypothetical protein